MVNYDNLQELFSAAFGCSQCRTPSAERLFAAFDSDSLRLAAGGAASVLARIIYTIIALAGIFSVSMLFLDMDDYAEHRA